MSVTINIPTPSTGSAGEIQFKTSTGSGFGASSNLFWDNANNRLGIGTSTPLEALQVVGNIHVSDGNRSIFNRSNNFLSFGTNNTERFRIFANGNIGINTTTDAGFRLDVNGTARVTSLTAGLGWIIGSNLISMPGSTNGFIALNGDRTLNFTNGAVNVGIINLDGANRNVLIGNGISELVTAARLVVRGAGATSATTAMLVQNSAKTALMSVRNDGVVLMNLLPTSASGLPSGALWNNGGVLNIV